MSNEIFAKKKDKSSLVVSIIGMLIIIAVMAVAFLNAGNESSDITGAVVAERSVDNVGDNKPSSGEVSVNQIESRPVSGEHSFQQTTFWAELLMQDYELSLTEADIQIVAEHVTLVSPDFEMIVDIDEIMQLKSFNGKIIWQDSQLMLEGQLYKHLATYFEISWKNPTDVKLRVEDGFLEIKSLSIDNLNVLASGMVTIGDEMELKLKDKELMIYNYEGSFKSAVNGQKNTAFFDGTITDFSTDISNIGLELGSTE